MRPGILFFFSLFINKDAYFQTFASTSVEQLLIAEQSKVHFQEKLSEAGRAVITTELMGMPAFYYAEEYHQQYLSKNPGGYCGLGGVGVKF